MVLEDGFGLGFVEVVMALADWSFALVGLVVGVEVETDGAVVVDFVEC